MYGNQPDPFQLYFKDKTPKKEIQNASASL